MSPRQRRQRLDNSSRRRHQNHRDADRARPYHGGLCSRAPRRRAFTLVELLVVIGIIAVLIGILLPVLGRAQARARRAACANQLRQVGVAALAYAIDNHGWLPEYQGYVRPGTSGKLNTEFRPDTGAAQIINLSTTPATFQDFGLGRLVLHKYIPDPKIMICPGMQSAINANNKDRVSYFFNPHPAQLTPISPPDPATPTVTSRFKRVRDFNKEYRWRCLACDYFISIRDCPHKDDRQKVLQLNLLFIDGHVGMHDSKEAYGRLYSVTGPNGGTNNSWVRVNDVIGPFEYLEAGRTPMEKMGGPTYSNACSDFDPFVPPVSE